MGKKTQIGAIGWGLLILTSNWVLGQGTPSFEVASIKAAAPMTGGRMMLGMGGDPGRVSYTNVTLKDVLPRAYGVKRYQITGPSWIESERYDIAAKVPDNAPKEQIPAMLQALLVERFQLKTHREKKDLPVYALTTAKSGPKLEKVADDGAGGRGMMTFGGGHMEFQKVTISGFADMLSNMLDRPVLDLTELEGSYKITLDVSMEDMAGLRGTMMRMGPAGPGGPDEGARREGAAVDPAPSIFAAVQQLGLKLESRKAPLEMVVVDDGNKVPTEN